MDVFRTLLKLSLRLSRSCVCFRAGDKDSSPPPPECLQLLSRATQVFREEYILKLGLAHEEMQRRYKIKLF